MTAFTKKCLNLAHLGVKLKHTFINTSE